MSSLVPEGWNLRLAENFFLREKVKVTHDRNSVSERGSYPVIDQSEDGEIGFVDVLPEFDCSPQNPIVTFANHTCAVRKMTMPFGVIQNVFPLSSQVDSDVNFVYQALLSAIEPEGYKGHYPKLRETEFLTPPLPEQKKIASILTSVDEVIENTSRQIDKLQDLKKATMNELLTKGIGHTEFKDSELGRIPKSWEVESLSNFIRRISSGWSPVCYPEQRVNKEWAVLKTTAVVWSGYDPSENKVLPDKFAPKKTATVGDNELLITRKGPRERVGVCVSTGSTPINLMIPDTVFKLILKETLSSTFAALMLGTHIIQRDWDRKKIGLAEAQVNINHGIINETKIPLPPEEERQKICRLNNRFDLRLNALRTKLSQTQSLKKSLMQDLLTGKVRVMVN